MPERSFIVADPRDFDGTPFEVAGRAAAQLEGLLTLLLEAVPQAELMARNAEMTRRIDTGSDPEGDRWVEEPQGRQWALLKTDLTTLKRRVGYMRAAAAFDPKHPPR